MNLPNPENLIIIDESLLGGAALAVSDIASIEASEIKWMVISSKEKDLDIQVISA